MTNFLKAKIALNDGHYKIGEYFCGESANIVVFLALGLYWVRLSNIIKLWKMSILKQIYIIKNFKIVSFINFKIGSDRKYV